MNVPSLIAALPLPTVLIGPDGLIAMMSPEAEAMLGSGAAGRPHETFLRQPAVLDAIAATRKDGTARSARYTLRGGARDTIYLARVAGVTINNGQGALVTFEDQTARAEADQMRRDFVANLSHELRTPLTALAGFVETLQGPARNDSAAQGRFLDIMQREVGRMTRLVQDLLSLSRVEESERQRPRQPTDLTEVVAATVASLGPVATAAKVELSVTAPSTPVMVPGDAAQLQQVLSNLVENAIKYGGSGGLVEIGLTAPALLPRLNATGIALTVRDHGEGIPARHIPRLTERFYRVDDHRSRAVGGTGLGLAIVKHIVNRHRGRLLIDSTIGQGTTFTILLPSE